MGHTRCLRSTRRAAAVLWLALALPALRQDDGYPPGTLVPSVDLGLQPTEVIVADDLRGEVPEGLTLNLPPGFTASVFAAGLRYPRFMAFDEGGVLHVANMGRNQIVALPDRDGDGVADAQIVVATGFELAHSLAFYRGQMYVADTRQIVVLRDGDGDLVYEERRALVDGIPSQAWHTTRTIVIDEPKERIYLSVGSPCDLCRPQDPVAGAGPEKVPPNPEWNGARSWNSDSTGRAGGCSPAACATWWAWPCTRSPTSCAATTEATTWRAARSRRSGSTSSATATSWATPSSTATRSGTTSASKATSSCCRSRGRTACWRSARSGPSPWCRRTTRRWGSSSTPATSSRSCTAAPPSSPSTPARPSSPPTPATWWGPCSASRTAPTRAWANSSPGSRRARRRTMCGASPRGWRSAPRAVSTCRPTTATRSSSRSRTARSRGPGATACRRQSPSTRSSTSTLTVVVERLAPGGSPPRVLADLSELGGPSDLPLEPVDQSTYRLGTRLAMAGVAVGPHSLRVRIEQEVEGQLKAFVLTRTISVLPRDLSILDDALAAGWALRGEAGAQVGAPAAAGPVFHGARATAVRVAPRSFFSRWAVHLSPPEPLPRQGFAGLRLALHPGDLRQPAAPALTLYIEGLSVDLLRPGQSFGPVDLDRREWQVVEIPFQAFDIPNPYAGGLNYTVAQIAAIQLEGHLTGTFYLDDVRLVTGIPAAAPPPVITAVGQAGEPRPDRFDLAPCYPNPFNSTTTIGFALPQAAPVELSVYNLGGQEIRRLASGWQTAGWHATAWDGTDDAGSQVATGVYVCRLRAADGVASRKVLLLR